MAVTAKLYGYGALNAFLGLVDWDTNAIKVALIQNTYTPDQDVDDEYADVSGNELANGSGYTTGGATLGTKTNTYTAVGNIVLLGAADTSWAAITFTGIRYAVIYDSVTNKLIGYVDFGADQAITSGTFQINWHDTDKIVKATVN